MCCAIALCGRTDYMMAEIGMRHGSVLPIGSRLRRDRFHCYICYVLPELFPSVLSCPKQAADGRPCRFVKGHHGECKGPKREESVPEAAAARDGDPKLAAERKRKHPMFVKRHRVGPHR